MKRSSYAALAGAVAALLAASVIWAAQSAAPETKAPAGKTPGGKELFTTYKCTSCHSVETEKIEKKKTAETEEGDAAKTAAAEPAPAKKNPDLSGVGAKKDATWISKYLMKEEKLDEKLHKTGKFKGTPEELKTISTWLESLKSPAKKSAEPAK